MLTLSVVVQVQKLVAPLGHDTKRILKKSDNDEESADGREIPIPRSTRQQVLRNLTLSFTVRGGSSRRGKLTALSAR